MRVSIFAEVWRHRLTTTSILWVIGVFVYWQLRVPLAPSAIISLKDGWVLSDLTHNGDPVLRMMHTVGRSDENPVTGPIRVRSLRSGGWISPPIGDKRSSVEAGPPESGLAIEFTDQILSIVRLSDGVEVLKLRGIDPAAAKLLSNDRRFFLVRLGESLRVYRISDGRVVWSVEGVERVFSSRFVGPELLAVTFRKEDHLIAEARNTTTWESDRRFADNQLFQRAVSADARYSLNEDFSNGEDHWAVFNYHTGQKLWGIPRCLVPPVFSADGASVIAVAKTDAGGNLVRWRSEDGGELARFAVPTADETPVALSTDGQFLIGQQQSKEFRLPDWMAAWLSKHNINWVPTQWPQPQRVTIRDVATGKTPGFGLFDGGPNVNGFSNYRFAAPILASRSAFAIQDRSGDWQVYRLPPARNWKWLLGWGLGPILVIGAFRQFKALRRRNRTDDGSVAGARTIVEDSVPTPCPHPAAT